MTTREDIRLRMQEDGIEYLLTQFVDIHGAPKLANDLVRPEGG